MFFFGFQRIVFGDLGQLGYLVQKLAGVELKLDHVRRLRLNKMVEIVQNPEVTAKLAIHNLVQVSKIQHFFLFFKGSLWYQMVILRLLVARDDI